MAGIDCLLKHIMLCPQMILETIILDVPRRTHAKENVAIQSIMRKDVVCSHIFTKYFSNGLRSEC